MKIRKITAFIVAVLSVFVTLASIPSVAKVSAEGASTGTAQSATFVQGFAYSFDYITSKLYVPSSESDKTKITKVEVVVGNEKPNTEITSKHVFTLSAGEYAFKLHGKDADDNDVVVDSGSASKITVVTSATAKSSAEISFKNNKDAIDAYNAALQETVNGLKLNKTLNIPELNEDLVSFTYYNYADLKALLSTKVKTLYYCKPNSNAFTSTTGTSITLSNIGTYSFYFELNDSFGNTLSIDKDALVAKELNNVYGWYDEKDTDPTDDDVLVAPIFTFECTGENVQDPEITIAEKDKVESGFLNLAYNDLDDYVTVTGINVEVKYELWYYAASATEGGLVGKYLDENNELAERNSSDIK